MGDYLIEFNNNNKPKAESEIHDADILNAMRRRREVLPPMWDVFERNGKTDEDKFEKNKASSSKISLKTGKVSVTHRRYIVAKGAFPCSLCGRCFLFNQGRPREGIPYADADILPGDQDSATDSPTEYPQRDDGLYSCPQCGKLFPRRSSLKRHQQIHFETRKFVCKHCGKGFNRNEHLTRHMLSHTNNPYQCDLCSKVFTRKEHLVRHKLSHSVEKMDVSDEPSGYNFSDFEPTDDKPFVCDICHQCYARREHMAKHKKIAHGIEIDPELEPKPYCCNHCFKTFTRKEHLTRHKKIHLREAFSGNYEIADGVSPSLLIAGPPGSKNKEKPKKDVLIPLTVNSKLSNVTITPQKSTPIIAKSSTIVTPPKSTPQVSVKQVANVTPLSVNKDTVTLEISGGGTSKIGENIMNNIFKKGQFGEISIVDLKKEEAHEYDESADFGKNLTEEEKAQLEGFLAETSFGGMDFMGGSSSSYDYKKEEDEYMEKDSIDMEDLKKMPKCRICSKPFTKKNHLNRHLKRYHNLSKEQISSGKFEVYENGSGEVEEYDIEELLDDEGNPISKRPKGCFPCDICKKTFTRKYHMYRHQKTQHGIDFPSKEQQKADNLKCMLCSIMFKNTEELRKHSCKNLKQEDEEEEEDIVVKEAKRKPKNTFKCAICKGTFENHDGFKDHVCKAKFEKREDGKKGYKCEQCGELFEKTRHLAHHLETHMDAMKGMLFT